MLAIAAAAAMTLTALAGTATAAQNDTGITPAAGCYDGVELAQVGKGMSPGLPDVPAKTSTRCNDINVQTKYPGTAARVCFYAQQDPSRLLYCQDRWTAVKPTTWMVIATNVHDGQPYRVQWREHPEKALVRLAA
ncbi:hypothetical protein SZMC14600_14745 [Saccharomonospora azurea SZMC 14600]|nr:hypothetical protein SZMC14600_14745 [Saccharomonospora azurea SZMC 14600]